MKRCSQFRKFVAFLGSLALVASVANAQFPGAGTDNPPSDTDYQFTFNGAGGCPAVGPININNVTGNVSISHAAAVGDVVDLTLNSLNQAFTIPGIGNVVITLDPAYVSGGTATALTPGSGDFPASSTLTVHYIMTTDCGVYYGEHVFTNSFISNFPPLLSEAYSSFPSTFFLESAYITPAGILDTPSHAVPVMGTLGAIALALCLIVVAIYLMNKTPKSASIKSAA